MDENKRLESALLPSTEKKEDKEIKSVIPEGAAGVQNNATKKRLKESFFVTDLKSVGEYVLYDVFIPGVVKTIEDLAVNSIRYLFHGEKAKQMPNTNYQQTSYGLKPSYRAYYDSNQNPPDGMIAAKRTYAFDDLEFPTEQMANDVMKGMIDILAQYGQCSIADMYDLAGVAGRYTDNRYGWRDLKCYVYSIGGGKWAIRLPKPIALN